MPASIDITDVGIPTDSGAYTVEWAATNAVDMPDAVFVHKYATRTYSHVASPSDLPYPEVPTPNVAFYRSTTATYTYPDMTSAQSAKINVAAAVQSLVDDYNAGLATFIDPTTTTYT